MLKLYQTNSLIISDITDYSVFADGYEHGALPLRDAPDNLQVNDVVEAFVYPDSDGEIVATMAKMHAKIWECAYLKVISSGTRGTYLDWGLPKDLLLPYSEQVGAVREGDFCVVYVYQDEGQRPVATMKLHRHLDEDGDDLEENQPVDLMVVGESELGFKAAINNEQLGLIHHSELSQSLEIGSKMKGWVKTIRADGKINLNINKLDTKTRDELEQKILTALEESGGRLDLSDKSPPELIYERFAVSKKNFKRAIGSLYKQRLITISPAFIELLSET